MELKDFLKAIEYKITEGSDYGWSCFGPDARGLDCQGDNLNEDFSVSCVFDSKNQTVYSVEAWDYRNNREYRWIDPNFKDAHRQEALSRNIDPSSSYDDFKYIDVDVEEDILEKVNAMVNHQEYDDRVMIQVNFSDDELLKYMKMAHQMDITFNAFVERALTNAIEEYQKDPIGFKKRAEEFKNEDPVSE